MDRYALAEGQALLGNGRAAAALEFAGMGGRFRCNSTLAISTSGAEMPLKVDGKRRKWRTSLLLEAGQELVVGHCLSGVYGYLHMQGGIDCAPVLGSRSSHIMAGIGWIPRADECLCPRAAGASGMGKSLPTPAYFGERKVRILRGPQTKLFSPHDVAALTETTFSISWSRNRIGARLDSEGHPISADVGVKLVSAPIVAGDLQVSANGKITALLADCQPMGGYPRIATIVSADLHKFVQLQSGAEFKLAWSTLDEALEARRSLRAEILRLAQRAGPAQPQSLSSESLLCHSLISGVVKGDEDEID